LNREKKFSEPLSIFWFRRDLRLEDNAGFYQALVSGYPVLALFIFDQNILETLSNKSDRRVQFIHQVLYEMQKEVVRAGSTLWVEYGRPMEVFEKLLADLPVAAVHTNHDYEPDARKRDEQISRQLAERNIPFYSFKDQVIFEKEEILTQSGKPYSVFTPYRNRWREQLSMGILRTFPSQEHLKNLAKLPPRPISTLSALGFLPTEQAFPPKELGEKIICGYHRTRDIPGMEGTTRLGVHLRFGTVSVRRVVQQALELNETFLNELIWREFFMMILWHFPHIVSEPFREKYRGFPWRHDKGDFNRWCEGQTGFPMVDAGMRQLNATGYMHNRVRMITANFLTKLLRIDWRLGEAYFAGKLLDYEQASNVGNWQWSAGCGVDAAPYFRIFNPDTQLQKFDPNLSYVKTWVPEYETSAYPKPIIDYQYARQRALEVFKDALQN
jgi:deoxyribodipyrimidine photo-lyase